MALEASAPSVQCLFPLTRDSMCPLKMGQSLPWCDLRVSALPSPGEEPLVLGRGSQAERCAEVGRGEPQGEDLRGRRTAGRGSLSAPFSIKASRG